MADKAEDEKSGRKKLAALFGAAAAGLALLMFWRRGGQARRQGFAHRADGADDSASFAAEIADEGTIPDVEPR
jgi:hypothetical protein